MLPPGHVILERFGTEWEAYCRLYFLERHGVEAILHKEKAYDGSGSGTSPFIGDPAPSVLLLVKEEDAHQAREILQDAPQLTRTRGSLLQLDLTLACLSVVGAVYLLSHDLPLASAGLIVAYAAWLTIDIARGKRLQRKLSAESGKPSLLLARAIARSRR